jgi:hypothetical protein
MDHTGILHVNISDICHYLLIVPVLYTDLHYVSTRCLVASLPGRLVAF